jgi:peptide-methionine (S)-S-oxide reductase
MLFNTRKIHRVAAENALPGRSEPLTGLPETHAVNGHPLQGPWLQGMESVLFGMGCFWGAERRFWQTPGVYSTAVGYTGGFTPNPSYEEVCSGLTGHFEAVLVVFEPEQIALPELLKIFWESHDPTQGMRQGNDIGTQYRSAIHMLNPVLLPFALASRDVFQQALHKAGYGAITTEIAQADIFYYAEPYHQQYLAKNPDGYCGVRGTGVAYTPIQ